MPTNKTVSLPHPQRERWQPLRSGFLNLYRYDREEFHYENGRLLLRGNNGTGKSRVLALQLPFLLDGEVISQRLEPDADPAKRVEWNLLMGRYSDRTGYTWIEFGRRDENGTEHFITLGCGLSAVEDQSGVRRWFFITTQRIGKDLELTSDARQVLGKDRLRDRIGTAGGIFEDVGIYRRAVNDALFHLDDYRYGSLMNLLIQLRRPQLTRQFDESELSAALSEALPPVSAAIIANVAEAFRSLESDRSQLQSFKAALAAVDRFLKGYRHYAEVAAKRRVDRVRNAHYEYESWMKEILISEAECDRSLAELAKLKSEIQHLSVEQQALQAEIDALQQSPQMKDGQGLERAHREAKEKRDEAEAAAAELADAVQARKARSEDHLRIKAALDQCQIRLTAATEVAARAALSAGLDNVHRETLGSSDVLGAADARQLRQARETIEAAIQSQMAKVQHVRRLNERISSERNELQQASTRRDQISALLDDARERLKAARQEHNAAITSFLMSVSDWRAGLAELPLSFDEEFVTAVAEWGESPQLSSPLSAAIRKSLENVTRNCTDEASRFQQLHQSQSSELQKLKLERERLGCGEVASKPRPGMRAENVRESRPGAPLWLLCDFADHVDTAFRPNIEAAMEAAGLLDAWVMPSGELLDSIDHDTVLVPATSPLPPEDSHLGTILMPTTPSQDVECQVPPYVVADILRHIGSKPDVGPTWISTDGQWQNGPVRGCWTKPAAEFIGERARETARQQRIMELDAAIVELQTRVDSLANSISELNRRVHAAQREADAAPSDQPIRTVYDQAVSIAREIGGFQSRFAEAEDYVAQKRSRLDASTENRDRAVVDLGISRWSDDLDALEDGVFTYRLAVSSFWPALDAFRDTRTANERAWRQVEEAGARERRQKEIADRLERSAITAEVAYDTLRQAVSSDFEQVLQRLEQTSQRLDDLRIQDKETRARHHDTELAVTRVDERLRNRTEMLNGQTDRRDAAASSLRAFACTKLLQLAVPGVAADDASTWSVARIVEVVFDAASTLESVESSDLVWEHLQKSVPSDFNELMRTLSPQCCQPSAAFCDEVFVATAWFAGRERTMVELHEALSEEVSVRQMLLEAREREILENHLAGSVSNHLHRLLNGAEEQVRQMNVELESCPMSTGMKLRFVWRPAEDGPIGLTEVRRRLMRSTDTWSAADCRMLGAFLQQQIQAVSSLMEGATWQESLAEALDYRKWHRFGVERYQDGVWKRLNRRTHGTGSGGEKAVALTLPHFAAAAAFYRTADRMAPRLILLDEAFVGIDADMRAKCMGLIHTFDLDFMMTSEREWGCYSTLPGIAIYQLSTRPGIDAIGLTRWVWTGQQRVLKDDTPVGAVIDRPQYQVADLGRS
jgi:uncharacterized protein (TIGR02680 family)